MTKMLKNVATWVGVYCPRTQIKCLFKGLVFGTCKKNILIYSQMKFQLYQSHSMTTIGLKSRKKSINSVSVVIKVTLKLKIQTSNFSQTNITYGNYI